MLRKAEIEREILGLGGEGEGVVEFGDNIFEPLLFELVFHPSGFHTGNAEQILHQIDETVVGKHDTMQDFLDRIAEVSVGIFDKK